MTIHNHEDWKEHFIMACKDGHLEDVRHLCQKQYLDLWWANLHAENDEGFRLACWNGHLDVVKYLLTSPELKEAGHTFADIHAIEESGFKVACQNEHWNMVRWLVLDYGIKKTPDIEKIIQEYPQAQEYFRVREELKEIKALIKETSVAHPKDEFNEFKLKEDERAAKKAKKL